MKPDGNPKLLSLLIVTLLFLGFLYATLFAEAFPDFRQVVFSLTPRMLSAMPPRDLVELASASMGTFALFAMTTCIPILLGAVLVSTEMKRALPDHQR